MYIICVLRLDNYNSMVQKIQMEDLEMDDVQMIFSVMQENKSWIFSKEN